MPSKRKLAVRGPDHLRNDLKASYTKAFTPTQQRLHKENLAKRIRSKPAVIEPASLDAYTIEEHWSHIQVEDDAEFDDDSVPIDASFRSQHGSEWEDEEPLGLEQQIYYQAQRDFKKMYYRDYRKRRDKIEIDQQRWSAQLDDMVIAYMDYCYRHRQGASFEDDVVEFEITKVTDFFAAYDVFLAVKNGIRKRVRQVLGRDGPNWRALNSCPPCQYTLEGEAPLGIDFMGAMDGNNSLKRVERRDPSFDTDTPGRLRERSDPRIGGGDYFILEEEVDKWDEKNWPNLEGYKPPSAQSKSGKERGECEDRWDNMKDRHTAIEFGSFKQTGVFIAVCRHKFLLWIMDMVKSGEKRKYGLAILHRFLTAVREERVRRGLPPSIGKKAFGYDIGCQFKGTVEKSPLAELAAAENLKILIGILHGHAHGRLCQIDNLMTYVEGAGIEDLEACERYFSQSNALASATRYASEFHRRQMIAEYAYHQDNFETYANLSKFIYNNYRQALEILQTNDVVARGMRAAGLTKAEEIEQWLEEEKDYLRTRQQPTERDNLVVEYYAKLVALAKCRKVLSEARSVIQQYDPNDPSDKTALAVERKMRQEREKEWMLLEDVQGLETRLEIKDRWLSESEDWKRAEEMARKLEYQKTVDRLEGLVVARLFELARMNMAGTGYKMRRHLGQALKTRSQAIKEALKKYNEAAARLSPPRNPIEWEDIVEQTYLSELDFLRETREDVRDKAWAKPANRVLMTQFFKLFRADEELARLHIEIKRLVTYMKEERDYLTSMEVIVSETDPALAYQIFQYRWERERFNGLHRMRLRQIYKLKGFDPQNLRYFSVGLGLRRQTAMGWPHGPAQREDDLFALDREEEEVRRQKELDRRTGGGQEDPSELGEEDWESEGEEEEEEAEASTTALLGVAIDKA
ncbi:hypothetical protein VKT23_019399 [Stygiomarasmius scandens]|uniref:Uncharacterized protein n=1 Tax=Marasmiellus scandens TaxID=2682957 RepID=A0ABR1INK6_9AGAR